MKFLEEKDEKSDIKMESMIDCVFLLLLYFMCSAQIVPTEKYLGLMMPGGEPPPPEILAIDVRLTITETGQVLWNDAPVDTTDSRDLPQLRDKIVSAIGVFGDEQPFVIHPSPKVRQQRIIDVVDACSASGVKKLSFFGNFK